MFSAMDATRTEVEFLKQIFKAVEDAKVDIVNVPDTVGVATPFKFYEVIKQLRSILRFRSTSTATMTSD